MVAVLAVDPGTCTGWACSDGRSGAATMDDGLAKLRREKRWPEVHGRIADRFRRWLDAELSRSGAGVLVLEEQMAGRGGGRVTLGLRMVALELMTRRKILVDEVNISRWQAWARKQGRAAADKGDEADAQWLLRWWESERKNLLTEG